MAPRQKFDFKVKEKKKGEGDIIAMDKTKWFDMVSPTIIDTPGAKSVALKTTGHEKKPSHHCPAKADTSNALYHLQSIRFPAQ